MWFVGFLIRIWRAFGEFGGCRREVILGVKGRLMMVCFGRSFCFWWLERGRFLFWVFSMGLRDREMLFMRIVFKTCDRVSLLVFCGCVINRIKGGRVRYLFVFVG